MQHLPQVNVRTDLQTKPERSSVQRALDDRLMLSEAIAVVGDLLQQFPTVRADMPDGFMGALAQVLTTYPRQAVVKMANPVGGLASEEKFLNIAVVVAWLEKKTEPMRADVVREKRVAEQLAAREAWKSATPSQSLIEKTSAWLNRTDPKAAQLAEQTDRKTAARRAASLAEMETANRKVFLKECQRDGINPERGVSPSLLKLLEQHHV